ncbi:MAG: UDP-N-acetylmuramate dehydrogenase, partial [Acidobacteriota bacterium]
VVQQAIARNYAGIECLSGIPGSAGATPVQNVGAYGQEVAEVIRRVEAIEVASGRHVSFSNEECLFAYRSSRFKYQDKGKYIITRVIYGLQPAGKPFVRYDELEHTVAALRAAGETYENELALVRRAVLALRQKKSMLVREDDPNSRSCGSFFLNPVISEKEFRRLQAKAGTRLVGFKSTSGIKISAAWLIEQAGFERGYRRGGVGISANHILALVNYGGTSKELLELAGEIQQTVETTWGVKLTPEPIIVP